MSAAGWIICCRDDLTLHFSLVNFHKQRIHGGRGHGKVPTPSHSIHFCCQNFPQIIPYSMNSFDCPSCPSELPNLMLVVTKAILLLDERPWDPYLAMCQKLLLPSASWPFFLAFVDDSSRGKKRANKVTGPKLERILSVLSLLWATRKEGGSRFENVDTSCKSPSLPWWRGFYPLLLMKMPTLELFMA